MNWLSFFVGVLVGWIVEWLIDLFYWRRKWQVVSQEKETCQINLERARAQIRLLEAENRDLESWYKQTSGAGLTLERASASPQEGELTVDLEAPEVELRGADLDIDLEAPEVELPDADLDIDLEAPEVEMPEWSLEGLVDGLKARFPNIDLDGSIDRLKAKIPDLDIKGAIDGLKVDFPDLDIDGAFEELKAKLPGPKTDMVTDAPQVDGPDRAATVPGAPAFGFERDNLKRIEGIGPKIARLLEDAGIRTFAQLAAASTDHLRAILEAAGPNYRLADPTTWTEQARLAADGAWDEFQALQDRLVGGRKAQHPDE